MSEAGQQFDTFQQWVNKASSWLTRYEGKAICFDRKGRQCFMGREFMRARDENTFPVFWIWDWQVPGLYALLEEKTTLRNSAMIEAIDDTCERLAGIETSPSSTQSKDASQ